MRFVFLWLCAILFSGVVYGESDRDSLKVRLGAPRLNLGAPVLLTDSIPGAFIGGILLGIIEILSKAYISSQLADAIVFAVLIVVLLVKPTGLLGKKIQEKV